MPNSLLDMITPQSWQQQSLPAQAPQFPINTAGFDLGALSDPFWGRAAGHGLQAAFDAPGVPSAAFVNANRGMAQSDFESPLTYVTGTGGTGGGPGYQPRDTGGFFTLDELYRRTQPPTPRPAPNAPGMGITAASWNTQGVPGIFQRGSNLPSTNNWRLTGMGPGWIIRNGQLINAASPEARQGLPLGYDTSYSDTAESGAPGLQRYVNPGAALAGVNKWDAYYWPGGQVMGRTRWPFQTNV